MSLLHHLTLNTGHVARTVRADVDAEVVSHLLPIIDAEGGPIPWMAGWYLDFLFPNDGRARIDGGAFFQVADEPGTSKRPVLMAIAAWTDAMSPAAWSQATAGYGAMRPTMQAVGLWRDPPADPPALPWLAVWLTPHIGLADAATLLALGDLGRCVAWALIP